jgi:hypothetical protein
MGSAILYYWLWVSAILLLLIMGSAILYYWLWASAILLLLIMGVWHFILLIFGVFNFAIIDCGRKKLKICTSFALIFIQGSHKHNQLPQEFKRGEKT